MFSVIALRRKAIFVFTNHGSNHFSFKFQYLNAITSPSQREMNLDNVSV